VALLDRSEQHHRERVDVVSALAAPLIAGEAVIAESAYPLGGIEGAAAAVVANVDRGIFQIPYRLSGNAAGATRLMRKHADAPMDFADACLVDMAADYQTGHILTLDTDFRVYRWGRNRPFELLLAICPRVARAVRVARPCLNAIERRVKLARAGWRRRIKTRKRGGRSCPLRSSP
jgi:predicted nucleic acid-binding protein